MHKSVTTHPSDIELANYIENRLDKSTKAKIVEHLIECDKCSDAVALVIKYGREVSEKKTPKLNDSKNKHKVVNNINYKRVGTLFGGLIVASLVLFINLPNETTKLGVIDLSKPCQLSIMGTTDVKLIDKIIDADEVLAYIIESTDLSHIESFKVAKEEEREKNFEVAKGLYTQALIQIAMESDIKQILQQKIVIHSRLLNLSKKTEEKKAIEEYKKMLRYEIRLYSLKNKEKK